MTHYIRNKAQNGLNGSPRISMNIVKRETNYPSSPKSKLRAMQADELKSMGDCPRQDYEDFIQATNIIIDAAGYEFENLMGRF